MSDNLKTIALLYPGEMGTSLARVLVAQGHQVVTCAIGRGEQTAARSQSTGIMVLQSLEEVVTSASVVISLVPPGASREVAETYCESAYLAPADALYVDANSIAPELAMELSDRVSRSGLDFVDGAINGLAKNLTTSGTFFLSGQRANEVADLLGKSIRVQVLGDQPGRASAMKMLLSGVSKGVCALFIETALIAQSHGMLPEMIAAYTGIYPGIMTLVERMLPTYAQHSARRAEEMRELEQTATEAGLQPCMLNAARNLHELLTEISFDVQDGRAYSVQSFIECLTTNRLLSTDAMVASDTG